ncbi:sensor histidine kinase [Chitinophaga qingshengii]|uniref:Histidine kinase n=1 Tax=Chitinophaga qingshengii TaxID=1569794 RepID=A0ABR7TY72_9BACT|nr:histidine kinase [Chitinophaga qingshengii]MBC9934451.1 histidine kinase [Chitinophaga qingshengii]
MSKPSFLTKTWPVILIVWAMDMVLTSLQIHMQGLPAREALQLGLMESFPSALCAFLLCYWMLPFFMKRRRMFLFAMLAIMLCFTTSLLTVHLSLPILCNSAGKVLAEPQLCGLQMMLPGHFIGLLFTSGTICGIRFYQEYAKTMIDHEHLRSTHLEAELTLLRGQLDPHSMFNMMNSIHVLIERDARQAADMVLEFSGMLRYQLYDASKPAIPLHQEIAYLQNYVNIENKRRCNELEVTCNWEPRLPLCYISPLILTPFVENAYKHVSQFTDQPNFIHIDLFLEGDTLFFAVKNSKEPSMAVPGEIPRHSGIGLINVKKRLALLYPDQHFLSIDETADLFVIYLEIKINVLQ